MWMPIEDTLPSHPKVIDLSCETGIDIDAVVGKLIRLWTWALNNRIDGCIRHKDVPYLSEVMRLKIKPNAMVISMVSVGLLDECDDGYMIHDWDEYTGALNEKRERNKQLSKDRMKRMRERNRAEETSVTNEDVTRNVTRNERNNVTDVTDAHNITKHNIEGRKEATAISSLSVCSAKTYSEVRDALSEYLHRDVEDWEVAKARELFRRHSDELVWRAISEACLHNAKKQILYAAGVISDWDANDITSIDELERWRMANGFS